MAPVKGLLKPLPAGLSLDYINEHIDKQISMKKRQSIERIGKILIQQLINLGLI